LVCPFDTAKRRLMCKGDAYYTVLYPPVNFFVGEWSKNFEYSSDPSKINNADSALDILPKSFYDSESLLKCYYDPADVLTHLKDLKS